MYLFIWDLHIYMVRSIKAIKFDQLIIKPIRMSLQFSPFFTFLIS
jgi:hypothetical protein